MGHNHLSDSERIFWLVSSEFGSFLSMRLGCNPACHKVRGLGSIPASFLPDWSWTFKSTLSLLIWSTQNIKGIIEFHFNVLNVLERPIHFDCHFHIYSTEQTLLFMGWIPRLEHLLDSPSLVGNLRLMLKVQLSGRDREWFSISSFNST